MDEPLQGDELVIYQALIGVRPVSEIVEILRSNRDLSVTSRALLADALDLSVEGVARLERKVAPEFQRTLDQEKRWQARLIHAEETSRQGHRIKKEAIVQNIMDGLKMSRAAVFNAIRGKSTHVE